jgi:hypothetical protein
MKIIVAQMGDPVLQELIENVQVRPDGEYRPSQRELKRRKIAANKRSDEVLNEIDSLIGAAA